MGLSWTRPVNVPFPEVWLTFKATDLNNDNLVNYRVQDLPIERYEEAIDYMFTHFLVDEPRYKVLGVSTDDSSAKEIRELYKLALNQNIVLVCFKEGSDEIIGINMLAISLKEEQKIKYVPSSEKLRIAFKSKDILHNHFDPFEHYNVDKYMSSNGLSVNSKYRGRRIGEYILRARIPLAKAIGITLTSSGSFSSTAAQKVASRAGFECNFEMEYDDIAKADSQCAFPGIENKTVKIMSMKI